MSPVRTRRYKVGGRLDDHHTVLGVVDDRPGRHPIYIAWDHRAWCPCVCKVFPTPERAERERSVLSCLAHPNIVRLMAAGDGPFVFLEHVEGLQLSELIDSRPKGHLSLSDALRVAIHVGGALEHVRERGFMHLDLSPSNVLVSGGRPVLIDFGTARRLGEPRPPRIAGTDSYIAPEECLLEEVTPAADVFGLGVSLYELLTGTLPFPFSNKRRPYPQTELQPTPLRARLPSLPRGLDELVLSCLQREPAARPTLVELLPRLHGFIRSGRRMWPTDFHPGSEATGQPRR